MHSESCLVLRPRNAIVSAEPPTVVNNFWLQFEGFTPNPKAGLWSEFHRLAQQQNWVPKSLVWFAAREDAYLAELESHYGNDWSKLDKWQALCSEVGVTPVPQSITKCKAVSISIGPLARYF